MSLEQSMLALAESNLKLAAAQERYAGVIEKFGSLVVASPGAAAADTPTKTEAAGKPLTAAQKKKAEKEAKKVNTKPEAKPQPEKKTDMKTPREQIAHLLPLFQAATGAAKKDFAKDILKIKQGAKKSWDVLGVPSGEVSKIKLLTD